MNALRRKGPGAKIVAAGVLALSMSLPGLLADDPVPEIPHRDFTDTPSCAVIRVVSGDTVIIKGPDKSQRIGLIGVQAPPRSQPPGHEARRFLENLLTGEAVYVVFAAEDAPSDKFGRQPAYLYRAPDGLFVNLELIRQGYAEVPSEERFEHRPLFEHFQQRAQAVQKGRWSAPQKPAPPPTKPAEPKAEGESQRRPPAGADDDVTVYVTASGTKYHREDCYHLRKSKRPLKLSAAKASGYQPCSHCKPPE